MSRFTTKLWILLLFTLLVAGQTSWLLAAPAYPGRIQYQQPDGTLIDLYLRGDEKINWAVTPDGYTLLANREGEFQYAVHDAEGNLVLSGVKVSETDNRSKSEKDFLLTVTPGLFFSPEQQRMLLEVWEMKEDFRTKSFPTTGERTLICILMQTPDVPFTRSHAEFDALFNQLNYTAGGATGSLRDYYLENSWNQFDLTVDVFGPFTASLNMAQYGSFQGARNLMTEGVHLANPYVNYADYDNDGDGQVDGVYMIFSGYGQEAGGGPNTIWSHAWSIQPVQLDGVWISRYACSPELRGNAQSNPTKLITRMGVIGHEFGHVLGAPDYYDTDGDGSGGNFIGTGQWDMMASGTWNNGGATPAHHNAFTKTHYYNWAEPTILDTPQSVTLQNSMTTPHSFFRINTRTPGEYYLLENRQQTGFDQAIPGQGMIIYHVSNDVDQAGNSVNVGHPQKMYVVFANADSDPWETPESYGQINTPFAQFPGQGNVTAFTDFTLRTSNAWSGVHTNKPITNITRNHANRTVSFDFMHPDHVAQWLEWDDGYSTSSVGLSQPGTFQIAKRFTPQDIESFQAGVIKAIKVYINQNATTARIKIWQGNDSENLVEYVSQSFWQYPGRWIMVNLQTPYIVNPDQELWIGAEFADPGAGVFPAGRDSQTHFDGKGNMIRTNVEDPTAWTTLTQFNIQGDWSIKALSEPLAQQPQFFNIELTATPATGGSVTGAGVFLANSQHTVQAQPAQDYNFLHWAENGSVVSTQLNYSFTVEAHRSLEARFEFAASVNTPELLPVRIWPNPAREWLYVQLPQDIQSANLRLVNVAGQIAVSSPMTPGAEVKMDIRHLPAGTYFLQWDNMGKEKTAFKVIVE